MTSMISRADVEDELVKAGVRDPLRRGKLMRVITAYALSMSRGFVPLPAPPADPYGYLRPGAADMTSGKMRCANPECLKVKPVREFHVDRNSPWGRRAECKTCLRKQGVVLRSRRHHPKVTSYYCRGCKNRKALKEFPVEKQAQPSLASWCSECDALKGET